MSKDSKIDLSSAPRDGSADVTVAVFCKETPVYKVLNALWSAVSYKQGYWRWNRSGEVGTFTYRLTQPRPAQQIGPRLRNWVQERFEANAQRLLSAVDAGEDMRKAAIREVYGTNPEEEAPNHWKGRLWIDILAFKESLTPEQQLGLLRGGQMITVPLSSLPQTSREHLLSLWREATVNNRRIVNGVELAEEAPHTVRFFVRKYESVPSLFVGVTSVPMPPGIGGAVLEGAYHKHVRKMWLTRYDSLDDPAKGGIMKAPDKQVPLFFDSRSFFMRTEAHVKRLEEIATASNTPVIARLPEEDDHAHINLTPVKEQSIGEYWKQLWRGNLMMKWHEGMQIVSTETWPMEDPPVPLWFIRSLRAQAKPGKFIPLQTLLLAADSLTEKQLRRLKPEFPVMDAVANGRGILALLHRNPALAAQALKPEGVVLTNQIGEALADFLPPQLASYVKSGEARRIALTIEESNPPRPRERRISFWLYGDGGRRLQGFGITEKPQPDPKSEK